MGPNGQPPQSSLLADIEGPLSDQQALQILVDGASVANLRGAFGLLESGNLAMAVKHFTKRKPEVPMPSVAPIPPEAKQMMNPNKPMRGESQATEELREPTPVMQSEQS